MTATLAALAVAAVSPADWCEVEVPEVDSRSSRANYSVVLDPTGGEDVLIDVLFYYLEDHEGDLNGRTARAETARWVDWWTADGETGPALVVPEATQDSGLFRFFDADNWEILIKVLNGCEVNGHYWVYGASTTDLGYVIRVADTTTGDVREYRNEPGQPAAAISDSRAFPDSCRP